MQRSGRFKRTVDCFKFSNHRMLSFCSIGTRVGLILFLSALVPLNFCRVQNLIAANQRETLCRDRQTRVHQAHGSVISWQHINLLGEYDFSDEKLQDNVGIRPPKLIS